MAEHETRVDTTAPEMKYEVVKNRFDQSWQASAHDEADGACYTVNFYGPGAEERAREYAAWKNRGGRAI